GVRRRPAPTRRASPGGAPQRHRSVPATEPPGKLQVLVIGTAFSRVNAPPAVVWTKKLKLSPACTEPISASLIRLPARKVTETDCNGEISQSGLVHVVDVLLAWTPRPLSARTLSGNGFSVRLSVPAAGPGAPGKPCATT